MHLSTTLIPQSLKEKRLALSLKLVKRVKAVRSLQMREARKALVQQPRKRLLVKKPVGSCQKIGFSAHAVSRIFQWPSSMII